MLLVLITATAIGASIQARRLAVAQRTASTRQAQAEELIEFMLGNLRDKLQPIGKLDVLDDIATRALAYFNAVPMAELSDDELFRYSFAVQQLGDVRRQQGKLPEAAALMRQALALAVPLAARDSLNPRWQIGLAHTHFASGQVEWQRGNVDAALTHFEPFVRISDRLMAHYPDSVAYRAEVAYALNNIGFIKEAKGDAPAALRSYRAALAIIDPLVKRDSTQVNWVITQSALRNCGRSGPAENRRHRWSTPRPSDRARDQGSAREARHVESRLAAIRRHRAQLSGRDPRVGRGR